MSNAISAKQRLNSYNSVSSGTRLLVVLYRVEVEHLSVFRTLRILEMLYYLLCNVGASLKRRLQQPAQLTYGVVIAEA